MHWKKLSTNPVYDGYRKIDALTFELPSGEEAIFDIKREGNLVCVLALTPDNKVILAKQFRPGPEQVLLEIPGGVSNEGEDFEKAAARELLEETGYAGDIAFIGTCLVDGYSTGVRYNYIARNCKQIQEPENNPHEPIEVVVVTLEEFRDHLRTGQLTDVATGYLALDFAHLL